MAGSVETLSSRLAHLSLEQKQFQCEATKTAHIELFSEKLSEARNLSKIVFFALKSIPQDTIELSSLTHHIDVINQVTTTTRHLIEYLSTKEEFQLEHYDLEDRLLKKAVRNECFSIRPRSKFLDALDIVMPSLPTFVDQVPLDPYHFEAFILPLNEKNYREELRKTIHLAKKFIKGLRYYHSVLNTAYFFRTHLDPLGLIKTLSMPPLTKNFVLKRTLGTLHFLKEDRLGEGTFGRVYKLSTSDQSFAYKVFKSSHSIAGFSKEEHFLHESAIMLSLPVHPAIVQLQALSSDGLFLSFSPLGTLFSKIHKYDYSYKEILLLFSDICDALHALHSAGFIHKDLKSNNILLFEEAPRARLADFSLTTIKRYDTIKEIMTHYKAPEVAFMRADECVSEKVDCWSFGVLLFETLTGGQLPFFNEKKMTQEFYDEVARERHLKPCSAEDLIEPLSSKTALSLFEKDPPRHLLEICARCLHGHPGLRADMGYVKASLAHALSLL